MTLDLRAIIGEMTERSLAGLDRIHVDGYFHNQEQDGLPHPEDLRKVRTQQVA